MLIISIILRCPTTCLAKCLLSLQGALGLQPGFTQRGSHVCLPLLYAYRLIRVMNDN